MENFKDIELDSRKWRISKLDAKTGSYMLLKVIGLLAPAFKAIDLKKIDVEKLKSGNTEGLELFNFTDIFSSITNLSEEEFSYIQERCLQKVYEILPAGLSPVLNANGSFGVVGIEEDTMLVLKLMTHSLIFNLSGFFDVSLLNSRKG